MSIPPPPLNSKHTRTHTPSYIRPLPRSNRDKEGRQEGTGDGKQAQRHWIEKGDGAEVTVGEGVENDEQKPRYDRERREDTKIKWRRPAKG